jgi:hypothetical protein
MEIHAVTPITRLRVVLVGELSLWCEGLQHILSRVEGVEVRGPWPPDEQLRSRLIQDTPDLVVIVDREEAIELGNSLTCQILVEHADLPVIRIQDSLRLYVSRAMPGHIAALLEYVEKLEPRPGLESASSSER